MPSLFERFHQIEEPGVRVQEGAGIGLSLVQEYVHLEMSEAAIMNNLAVAPGLNDLKMIGVKVDIDEFGHGCSSLKQLNQRPISSLKVNVRNTAVALSDTILAVGQHRGLDVVAKCVETAADLESFRQRKFGKVQGFQLCRPLSGDAFADWYLNRIAA